MQHALIIIGFPGEAPGHVEHTRMRDCLRKAQSIVATSSKIELLGADAWLIPLESDLPIFAALVSCAADWQIPSRTILFETRPALL